MATFQSPGFAHYSLAWSPFLNNTLAVAASANFGLIGNGRLNILSVDPSLASGPALQRQYVTTSMGWQGNRLTNAQTLDLMHKMDCTTLRGVKLTRIRSSQVLETDR